MRAAGAIVESHVDHFPIDAPDTEWLPEVSRRGWGVITAYRSSHEVISLHLSLGLALMAKFGCIKTRLNYSNC
ncbi:MAG: hypothetical protein AAFS06_18710 [Cyanobacteria bacterium J06631_12]